MQLGASNSVDTSTLKGTTREYANTLENVTAFTDAQIVAGLNKAQRRLQTFILAQVTKDWRDNGVDLNGSGTGSIDLVQNQNNYTFPTDLIMIDRIELNLSGNQNGYVLAEPLRLSEFTRNAVNNTEEFNNIRGTKNRPVYWVRGNEVFIDPIPDVAVTDGMKVYGSTKVTDLSGDTDEPVFVETFQEILCMDAALKYLIRKGKNEIAQGVRAQMQEMKLEMIKFYSNRQNDKRRRIKAIRRNYR